MARIPICSASMSNYFGLLAEYVLIGLLPLQELNEVYSLVIID